MIRQYTFDLAAEVPFRREDYFAAPSNAIAYAQVMDRAFPGGRMLLVGPAGAGKSHLAHIWAEVADAAAVRASDLAQTDLRGLGGALVVEDIHQIAGQPQAEEALFHLWNRSADHPLLLTAQGMPRDWGLALPDLLSRVQAMPVAQLEPPDDALLAAVLVKLFADRQVTVQPNLIAYLVARMERSVAAARSLVAVLDARALSLGRPITRAMAAEILGGPAELDSDGSQ